MDLKRIQDLTHEITRIQSYAINGNKTDCNRHAGLKLEKGSGGMVESRDKWLHDQVDVLLMDAINKMRAGLKKIQTAHVKKCQDEIQALAMTPELRKAISTIKEST